MQEQQGDNILVFPETSGFRSYETFFTEDSVQHPAKANLNMIKWIIEHYSKEGDTILDPMSGTFSTSLIAGLLNRNGVGVEYEDKFYNMGLANKEKFDKTPLLTPKGSMTVLKGDARKLSYIVDGAEIPKEEDDGKPKTYLGEMRKVYAEAYKTVKAGGLMVLITKNFVRKGVQVRLDLDTIKLCESVGFTFKERYRRKLTSLSFWQINYLSKWFKKQNIEMKGNPVEFAWKWNTEHPNNPVPPALWEDILVFQKPSE